MQLKGLLFSDSKILKIFAQKKNLITYADTYIHTYIHPTIAWTIVKVFKLDCLQSKLQWMPVKIVHNHTSAQREHNKKCECICESHVLTQRKIVSNDVF